jgi:hypothetical protein
VLRRALAAVSLATLVACSSHAAGGAQAEADKVTQAVYNNDATAVTQDFSDDLKAQVTRSDVGALSDKMHKLGDYKGLTYLSYDAPKDEFTYRADFSNGNMDVVIRFDAAGKVTAYRVFPPAK